MIGKTVAFLTALGDRQWYVTLGVSTCTHLCALCAFCFYQMQPPAPAIVGQVDTHWDGDPGGGADMLLDTIQWQDPAPPAAPVAAPTLGGSAAELAAVETSGPQIAVPQLASASSLLADWGGSLNLGEDVGALATRGGRGRGSGDGAGSGSGNGDGSGGGTGFFGETIQAERYVYVLDSSMSMNHPHPSEARTRLGRTKLELLRSVQAMEPNMLFYIIFFSDGAIPMPARKLVRAKDSERYLKWMSQIPAEGHTHPSDALLMALRLEPDVIYFLSDGDFEPGVALEVQRVNTYAVPIHTFCLGDRQGEPLLKRIAQESGGRYQFIP